jgi:hypothetical protein
VAECIILKGGGGADLDVITAGASDVLAGKVSVDKDGNPLPGAMPKIGTAIHGKGVGLNAQGVYYYIPKGFYDEPGQPNPWVYMTREEVAAAGGLTANKMISGQSAFGIAGSVNVQSILSFSAAVYSSTAITFTWQNPAKGPFSGVIMVGKTGSYPASITDGTRYYKGSGSNSAASGMSSATVTSFASGTTYYFRAFSYAIKDGGEWVSATTYTATVATTKGQQTFTASTIFTIPAGVRSIDLFCVGGGGGGGSGDSIAPANAGGGGGAGYTTHQKAISVTPGQQINIVIGAGGAGGDSAGSNFGRDGGLSKVIINGQDYCIANGGSGIYSGGGKGGSGGGGAGRMTSGTSQSAGNGGADGSDGAAGYASGGTGQRTTTRAFGEPSNTLYAGGGGGGGNGQRDNSWRGFGGAGGGGNGADAMGNVGSNGTAGTGGGGGGGYQYGRNPGSGYAGGSGICLIRWGY